MTLPAQSALHGIGASDAPRAKSEERGRCLGSFADDIESCTVVVRACEHHHGSGNRHSVCAQVPMHGRKIEAGSATTSSADDRDPRGAVAHAFDAPPPP